MKWLIAAGGGSLIAFVGLFAVIEARMTVEGESGTAREERPQERSAERAEERAHVDVVASPAPQPFGAGLEARLECEVIEPLRQRREWALGGRFSRAAVSRERLGFDFSRVEVPERLRSVAAAAIALEIGGERRLLVVGHPRADAPLEVRVGDSWISASAWIADRRSDLSAVEGPVEPLPRIARSGEAFEAVVSAQLIEPLEARRTEALKGALSRVRPSSAIPFELVRLDATPETWSDRSDGAIRIDPWRQEEGRIVPFRLETAGGELEVHVGDRWLLAREWIESAGPDLGGAAGTAIVPTSRAAGAQRD